MTPQQINAAIAADLGWTLRERIFLNGQWREIPPWFSPEDRGKPADYYPIGRMAGSTHPIYTTSLDAIRAAAMERFGKPVEAVEFSNHLELIADGYYSAGKPPYLWQLTAADWCEAYLRSVGKWEEQA